MTALYLHGLPGSGAELALAGRAMAVLDRDAPSFAQLALRLPEGPLHLVGFSLGAACALRLAALAPEKVARLTLISAAAPLEMGDFLPHMAGAPVFRMAQGAARMAALTSVQSALARVSPGLFLKLLMRGTDASDAALFRRETTLLRQIMQDGLGPGQAAYLREMTAYVRPWARHVAHVGCPVTLHHGSEDRWTPPAMAEGLAAALPHAELIRHAGLGHYATLHQVLSRGMDSKPARPFEGP